MCVLRIIFNLMVLLPRLRCFKLALIRLDEKMLKGGPHADILWCSGVDLNEMGSIHQHILLDMDFYS